jgi:polar amino acid transport system substrate-binding protein
MVDSFKEKPFRCADWRQWALAMLLTASGGGLAAQPSSSPIKVCFDDSYAPFEYTAPGARHLPLGATATLIQQILKRNHIPYQMVWYPWARCLASVRQGEVQLGMDAYYDTARARTVTYSAAYYTLTPQYFYSRRKFPHGLNIQRTSDLKKFRGCGIRGYTYTHYGLLASNLDDGALDDRQLVDKLQHDHCDYFVEELEVIQGYALLNRSLLDIPDLGHGPVPGADAPQMHFFLTKSSTISEQLLPLLNKEIERANKRGVMRQLIRATLKQNH